MDLITTRLMFTAGSWWSFCRRSRPKISCRKASCTAQATILDDRGFFVQVSLDNVRADRPYSKFPELEFQPDPSRREADPDPSLGIDWAEERRRMAAEMRAAKGAVPAEECPLPGERMAQQLAKDNPTTRYRWMFNWQSMPLGCLTIPPGYKDVVLDRANPPITLGQQTEIRLEISDDFVPACLGDGREGRGHGWSVFSNRECLHCKLRREHVYSPDGKVIHTFYFHADDPSVRTYYRKGEPPAPAPTISPETVKAIMPEIVEAARASGAFPPVVIDAGSVPDCTAGDHVFGPTNDDGEWTRRLKCMNCRLITAIYNGPRTATRVPGMYAYLRPTAGAVYRPYLPEGMEAFDDGN